MKRDMKPFLVEVKRGTRRSSFLGQLDQASTMSEAQRRAEAALFSSGHADVVVKSENAEPSRRILRSLVEPEPIKTLDPEDDEVLRAERRPRPVGRPRKPKPLPHAADLEILLPLTAPMVFSAPVASRTPSLPAVEADVPAPSHAIPATGPSTEPRQRLRDRSMILAKYVLGTEPAPGKRWSRSARRTERRGRSRTE